MPIYDYACESRGPFRDWLPMSALGEDVACPSCSRLSPRLVSMPALGLVSGHVRMAHERNERSADQPQVMPRRDWRALGGHLNCGPRCLCRSSGRTTGRPNVLGHAH